MEPIGPYIVERELGRGGMGVVYMARHAQLGRPVAIKRLLEQSAGDELARFVREAQALARVRHPGIVAVHDVGHVQGSPWMAMDLVIGESLADRLERDGPLPGDKAAALGVQLAEAMHYAHEQGFLHRDLKPDNVLLRQEDGKALVTDFGLARDESAQDRLTRTGEILGTPAFMAPEQADGDPDAVDRRADVYGLGATLYAAVSGKAPFEGSTLVNILSKLLTQPVTPPSRYAPDLDGDLETVILKCLEKEPADRYASAQELLGDLERYRRGDAISAVRASPWKRAGRAARKHGVLLRRLTLVAGAALVLGAVGLGANALASFLKTQEGDAQSALRAEKERKKREAKARREARQTERARLWAERKLQQRVAQVEEELARVRKTLEEKNLLADWPSIERRLEEHWKQLEPMPADDPARRAFARGYADLLFGSPDYFRLRGAERMQVVQRVLRLDPDHLDALRERAENPLARRDHPTRTARIEASIADADRALALGEEPDPLTLSYKADCLRLLDRNDEALQVALAAQEADQKRVAALPPDGLPDDDISQVIRKCLAETLMTHERWADARDAFTAALRTSVHHVALRLRGLCHMELGDYELARRDLRSAIRIKDTPGRGDGYWAAYCDLASLEIRLERPDAAQAVLDKALGIAPKTFECRWLRARLRRSQGDLAGALQDVDEAVKNAGPDLLKRQPELKRQVTTFYQEVQAKLAETGGQ